MTTSADLARDLTAGSLTISVGNGDVVERAKAEASTKGADDDGGQEQNADQQSSDQVTNNPNTNGKTDGSLPKASDSTDQGEQQLGQRDAATATAAASASRRPSRQLGDGRRTRRRSRPDMHVTSTGARQA